MGEARSAGVHYSRNGRVATRSCQVSGALRVARRDAPVDVSVNNQNEPKEWP
jgi:hypothetical protein